MADAVHSGFIGCNKKKKKVMVHVSFELNEDIRHLHINSRKLISIIYKK